MQDHANKIAKGTGQFGNFFAKVTLRFLNWGRKKFQKFKIFSVPDFKLFELLVKIIYNMKKIIVYK